ncbi:MAG: ABC transporter substrate-binding protein [Alphaproteobacteria bacterium]
MKKTGESGKDLELARIDRRTFAGGLAAGISLAGTALGSSTAASATQKSGGHFRLGLAAGQTSDTLDPAVIENTMINSLVVGVADYLTGLDQDSKIEPGLAETWEASSGASNWVFSLRKGVSFHNGKDLTADDVIASINYHRGEDSKSAAKAVVSQIKSISKDGSGAVRFELEAGNADFAYQLSDYHLAIFPSDGSGKIDWQSGIGSGPFMLESFEPGVRAIVKRNPNYWRQNVPHFDSAELLSLVDPTARVNALVTGAVDTINRVTYSTAGLLEKNSDITVDQVTGTQCFHYAMRCDTAPFDNPDVRLAVKYAINRDQFVSKVLKGYGSVGNDHILGPSNQFYDPTIEQRAYDPDKAKYHLKQAGLSNLDISLHVAESVYAGCVDGAVLFKESAQAAGINVKVAREPGDGYWSNVWMKQPMSASYWSGRPTADWLFTYTYAGDSKWNDTFWQNDRFNKILVDARSETNHKKRVEMYSELQKIMRNDNGAVVFAFADHVMARRNNVQHGKLSGAQDMDGNRSLERWWFS